MIEIRDLQVSFGDKRVLDGLNLRVEDGVSALSGPSGCGKTTLLRVLAGLQKPDGGAAEGIEPEKSVLLFQENRLLPRRRAAEQIACVLPRHMRGEAQAWLAFAELEGEGASRVEQLSGGMQRRLALARACALMTAQRGETAQPEGWLLLDEPFAGVDAQCARRILERVRALGVNVLLASHEEHVLEGCDRVIALRESTLPEFGGESNF